MEFTFDVVTDLKFPHLRLPINGYNNAYVKIMGDDELEGKTAQLLFKNANPIKSGSISTHHYKTTHFVQKFEDVNLKLKVSKNPFFKRHYSDGKIKTNSKLLIYVFGTHLNSSNIPIHGFCGCGLVKIFKMLDAMEKYWKKKRRKDPFKYEVKIKNREIEVGKIYLIIKEENKNIILDKRKIYHVQKIKKKNDLIMKYAYKEYEVVKSHKKMWSGVDNMMDLFWFSVFSNTIPVAFSCQKNRDITEEGAMILLYYSLRRFTHETGIKVNYDVPNNQSVLSGLSYKHKSQILATMLTLLAFSKTYSFDYYFIKGVKQAVETFMNGSEDVSDCEGMILFSIF